MAQKSEQRLPGEGWASQLGLGLSARGSIGRKTTKKRERGIAILVTGAPKKYNHNN
jgi:hypothetical protein